MQLVWGAHPEDRCPGDHGHLSRPSAAGLGGLRALADAQIVPGCSVEAVMGLEKGDPGCPPDDRLVPLLSAWGDHCALSI